MMPRIRNGLWIAILVIAAGTSASRARAADRAALATHERARQLGEALIAWTADRLGEIGLEEELRQARAAKAIVARLPPLATDRYHWKRWPHEDLSPARLAELLRPKNGKAYLAEIPRADGWGRPFEVVGSPANITFGDLFAIRSAGPNGRFEGPLYARGPWRPGEASDDVVWANGDFVRWPDGAPATAD